MLRSAEKYEEWQERTPLLLACRLQKILVILSPFFLQEKKERAHFKHAHKKKLLTETKKDYTKFPDLFKTLRDFIFYVKGRTPDAIAHEIKNKVKEIQQSE